jgi:hypothetical protein
VRWVSFTTVDPTREYLALVTYLPRKSYWFIFTFLRRTRAIQNQLNNSTGLVGYSMRAQIFGKKAWTLSVWENEDALEEFVEKMPHSGVMRDISHQLTGGQRFVRWRIQGSHVPPSWEDALTKIDESSQSN